ncbi:MAG: hypothetical protein HOG34_06780 [Bacteroidetes bacterium]|nr:hypothetical protein [Bacteroidota bacterium]
MDLKSLFVAIMLLAGTSSFSQNLVSGKIIDESSGNPVIDAHIQLASGFTTSSDSLGKFHLTISKFPAVIRITHVSYGQSDVTIDNWPEQILIIRIQKMVSYVGEVQVTAKRLDILTEKDDFSLQDFAFDDQNLWMIGYLNNQANKGRLWLANSFGDTICSISVHHPEGLYKDVFGNVHLLGQDSVFQLFAHKDTIHRLYPAGKAEFFALMAPIRSAFNGKLVYSEYLPQTEGLHIYYRTSRTDTLFLLNIMRDSLEELQQEDDYVGYSWSAGQDFRANQRMGQRKLNKHRLINRKVKAPLFSLNDSLWIFNFYKDSLLGYDSFGKLHKSIPIDFHRKKYYSGSDYFSFKILTDELVNKAYCLLRNNMEWQISEIDLKTGKLLPDVPLPNFPGMDRITVFRNAIYFLYPEKKYPFYSRLYRFQL